MKHKFTLLILIFFALSAFNPLEARLKWRIVKKEIQAAINACKRHRPELSDTELDFAFLIRYENTLKNAFSPEIKDASLMRRVKELFVLLDDIDPGEYPQIYSVTSIGLSKALTSLQSEHIEDFVKMSKNYWGSKSKRSVDKNVLQRILISEQLSKLMRSQETRQHELADLIQHLLQREVDWMGRLAPKPVYSTKAIELLKASHKSQSIYGLLDSVDEVYTFAIKQKKPDLWLTPIVSTLVELLGKTEVRVKTIRGEILPLSDERTVSQSQIWIRTAELLVRLTAKDDLVWYPEWKEFWALYAGENKVNTAGYDFVSAWQRAQGLFGQGTIVGSVGKGKSNRFFGIEQRSSKFLIILDTSGSMVENSRKIDRLKILKKEAIRFLRYLKPGSYFNILPYNSECSIGGSLSGGHKLIAKTLPRGKLNPSVIKWINSLKAGGKTRTDLAFQEAFGVVNKKISRKFKPLFQEIYFITDGTPTYQSGKALKGKHITLLLKMIKGLNARHRVIIHSIGFPGMASIFIQDLARQNNGTLKIIRSQLIQQPQQN